MLFALVVHGSLACSRPASVAGQSDQFTISIRGETGHSNSSAHFGTSFVVNRQKNSVIGLNDRPRRVVFSASGGQGSAKPQNFLAKTP
jgi:metal-dependent amidase/aminoacylase/carboxypeptidase family protein